MLISQILPKFTNFWCSQNFWKKAYVQKFVLTEFLKFLRIEHKRPWTVCLLHSSSRMAFLLCLCHNYMFATALLSHCCWTWRNQAFTNMIDFFYSFMLEYTWQFADINVCKMQFCWLTKINGKLGGEKVSSV